MALASFEKQEKFSIEKDVKKHNTKVKFLKLIERLEAHYLFHYDNMSSPDRLTFHERVDMVQTIIDRKPLKASAEEKAELNRIWKLYRVSKLEEVIANAPLNEFWPYKENMFFQFIEDKDKTFRYELRGDLNMAERALWKADGFPSCADAKIALHKKIQLSGNF